MSPDVSLRGTNRIQARKVQYEVYGIAATNDPGDACSQYGASHHADVHTGHAICVS